MQQESHAAVNNLLVLYVDGR